MRLIPAVVLALVTIVACGSCGSHAAPAASPATLAAPLLISPADKSTLNLIPRIIDYRWAPVPGALRYEIEIDCFHCCVRDAWCSAVDPQRTYKQLVEATEYTGEFPGDQPGRWRVRAIDTTGRPGVPAEWRTFTFLATRPPSPAPPTFRDPATGSFISGPGIVGPRAIYSPNAVYPSGAVKEKVSGNVFVQVTVDASGRVQDVKVVKSVRPDMDEAAVETMRTWRFEPARKGDQPVPAMVDVVMTFQVR